MHVDKPKDQDLAGHAITKFHLISSLTFSSNQNIQKLFTSLFPTGPCKSEIFISTLLSFLLRKELGSSLESSLKPTVNTSKGKESSIQFLLHTLSKKLRNSKTLLSSLPLIFSGPATRKGRSFHARAIYFYFPSRTINLVRVLVTLILESMISSRNFQ